jgi:rhodanese-related sulfurtransferase
MKYGLTQFRMKYLLLSMLLVTQCTLAQKTVDEVLQQYNTHSIPYISVEGLRALQINGEIVILDTRETSEFEVSSISGAKCVGFNDFSVEDISAEIKDKKQPIIVYCSLGIRSEEIGEKLEKAGYTNVQNLYGGIFEWKNKGYPVLNQNNTETDSVHTFSKSWSKWLSKGIPVYKIDREED